MAVYDRNQGLVPTTSQGNSSLLPSKDIGSVLVRSLQNALNASGDKLLGCVFNDVYPETLGGFDSYGYNYNKYGYGGRYERG